MTTQSVACVGLRAPGEYLTPPGQLATNEARPDLARDPSRASLTETWGGSHPELGGRLDQTATLGVLVEHRAAVGGAVILDAAARLDDAHCGYRPGIITSARSGDAATASQPWEPAQVGGRTRPGQDRPASLSDYASVRWPRGTGASSSVCQHSHLFGRRVAGTPARPRHSCVLLEAGTPIRACGVSFF